jgi:hypothetical protein
MFSGYYPYASTNPNGQQAPRPAQAQYATASLLQQQQQRPQQQQHSQHPSPNSIAHLLSPASSTDRPRSHHSEIGSPDYAAVAAPSQSPEESGSASFLGSRKRMRMEAEEDEDDEDFPPGDKTGEGASGKVKATRGSR